MHIMLAYDHSRNARIALDAVENLFSCASPEITLITVIEVAGSNTGAADDMFQEQFDEQKQGAEAAAARLVAAGMKATVLFAEGDARKMIMRAVEQKNPDLLVIARHSHKADPGKLGFIAGKIDAAVEEFGHMTFGAVSAFLARRATCPLLIIPTHSVQD